MPLVCRSKCTTDLNCVVCDRIPEKKIRRVVVVLWCTECHSVVAGCPRFILKV